MCPRLVILHKTHSKHLFIRYFGKIFRMTYDSFWRRSYLGACATRFSSNAKCAILKNISNTFYTQPDYRPMYIIAFMKYQCIIPSYIFTAPPREQSFCACVVSAVPTFFVNLNTFLHPSYCWIMIMFVKMFVHRRHTHICAYTMRPIVLIALNSE